MWRYGLLALLVGLSASPLLADDDRGHARVQLLADVSAISPGKPFRVGILFSIDPTWHVYWKNPGNSGSPTRVKLALPDGFTAGPLEFPTPVRIDEPGDVIVYGYEDRVLLTVLVTPPKVLPKDFVAKIEANVSWLVCQDVCIPGKQKLDISLPAGEARPSANADLFRQWIDQIPVPVESSPDVAGISVEGAIQSDTDPAAGNFNLEISWKKSAPKGIQLLPGPLDGYKVEDVRIQTAGDKTQIGFVVRTLKGRKPGPATLEAVVGYIDKDGDRRGVSSSITLPNSRG